MPEAPMQQRFSLPAPLNVRRTLGYGHGPRDPTTWRETGKRWRALRLPEGPATFCIAYDEDSLDGEVEVQAWGPGAAAVLQRIPQLLGAEDDPAAFVTDHPLIRRLQKEQPGLRLARGRPLAAEVLPTILGQRVKGEEAAESYREMVFALSEPAPGPQRLWLPPAPAALLRLRPYAFQQFDVERSRAMPLLEACRLAKRIDALMLGPPKAAINYLCRIRGIGPWTAISAVATSMGWPDAVILGDYHLPNLASWALAGEPRGDDRRMLQLLQPFEGQRGRVMRLLGGSGMHAPRRGPKRASRRTQVALDSAKDERRRR